MTLASLTADVLTVAGELALLLVTVAVLLVFLTLVCLLGNARRGRRSRADVGPERERVEALRRIQGEYPVRRGGGWTR